jgi:hypothetical protein
MISYWKTQWLRLVIAAICLVLAFYLFATGDMLWGVAWTVSFVVWSLMSFIDYDEERIKLLEKKAEKYDALVNKVDALQELLETEDTYLNGRIDSLVSVVEELRKK